MSLILAIETSCDETAAAVIEDGHRIRSNVVASQIEIHRPYGGVFPEIASRQHVLDIVPVIERALADAGVGWQDLAAMAVTRGPGLAGSLLVGVNTAKAAAWARGLPLIAVNHLEGHLYSNWLDEGPGIDPAAITQPSLPTLDAAGSAFPLLVLIVSGGHSEIILVSGTRRIPAVRRHAGRCGRRSLRQGSAAAGPVLSRRSGHSAGRAGRERHGFRVPARPDQPPGTSLRL